MHSDLIAKLEELDGPNWAIEKELAITIERDQWLKNQLSFPKYTASLDAVIALVERVLPGWSWEARKSGFGNGQASVWDPMDQPRHGTTIRADHKSSPAIALLIATIKALEARDG